MDPLVESFRRHAREAPDSPAVIEGGNSISRGDLLAAVDRRMVELRDSGVGADDLVLLTCPGSAAFVLSFLALRGLGAPVLLADPNLTPAELNGIQARFRPSHGWTPGRELARPLDGLSGTGDSPVGLPGQTSAIQLTSGSGGAPVGVAKTGGQILADTRQLASTMGFDAGDRMLSLLPHSHSYGFSVLPSALMTVGSTLVIVDEEDPVELTLRHGATVLPGVPGWFGALARSRQAERLRGSSLRLVISAGAPLGAGTASSWRERTGIPLRTLYGSTECGGVCFDRKGDAALHGFVGTAVEGVEITLESPEAGRGTLRVRSEAVASGYVPGDSGRAGGFTGDGFLTEDLARIEEAGIRLEGRSSAWINVRGKKIDPLEVEQVISELPGVLEVAVLGIPEASQESEVVRAVIATNDAGLGFAAVAAWCRERLAPHKRPRSVLVVEELPRTARGKVDLQRLREA